MRQGKAEVEWLEEAVARASGRYPDLAQAELEKLCAAALKLAMDVARDERERLAVFEAELDRGVEEQAVLGTANSVLPSASTAAAHVPSTLTAERESPEQSAPATQIPEHKTEDNAGEERRAPTSNGSSVRRPARRLESGMDYVLAAGRLRFHHGLEPDEIKSELGIDHAYYTRCMEWLLRQVEAKLERKASGHVDRMAMATFAAGLASIKEGFALERHMRECRACAEYLADLLDDAVALFDLAGNGNASERAVAAEANALATAGERLPASLATRNVRTSYTTKDVWASLSKRRRPAVPLMSLKAQSLRRYMPAADPIEVAASERATKGGWVADPVPETAAAVYANGSAPTPPGEAGPRQGRGRGQAGSPKKAPARPHPQSRRRVGTGLASRRSLIERLALGSSGRRGYATAFMTLLASLSVVEGGAAVTGTSSPTLSALDALDDKVGPADQEDADRDLARAGDQPSNSGPSSPSGPLASAEPSGEPPAPPAPARGKAGDLLDLSEGLGSAQRLLGGAAEALREDSDEEALPFPMPPVPPLMAQLPPELADLTDPGATGGVPAPFGPRSDAPGGFADAGATSDAVEGPRRELPDTPGAPPRADTSTPVADRPAETKPARDRHDRTESLLDTSLPAVGPPARQRAPESDRVERERPAGQSEGSREVEPPTRERARAKVSPTPRRDRTERLAAPKRPTAPEQERAAPTPEPERPTTPENEPAAPKHEPAAPEPQRPATPERPAGEQAGPKDAERGPVSPEPRSASLLGAASDLTNWALGEASDELNRRRNESSSPAGGSRPIATAAASPTRWPGQRRQAQAPTTGPVAASGPTPSAPESQPTRSAPEPQPAQSAPQAQPAQSAPEPQPRGPAPEPQPRGPAPEPQPTRSAPEPQPTRSAPEPQPTRSAPTPPPPPTPEPTPPPAPTPAPTPPPAPAPEPTPPPAAETTPVAGDEMQQAAAAMDAVGQAVDLTGAVIEQAAAEQAAQDGPTTEG